MIKISWGAWHLAGNPMKLLSIVVSMAALMSTSAIARAEVVDTCPGPPEPSDSKPLDECRAPLVSPSVNKILTCAGKAQDQLQQLRADLKGLYEEVNVAAQNALTLKIEAPRNNVPTGAKSKYDKSPLTRSELVPCAQGMQNDARVARAHLEEAQKRANEFVDAALQLKLQCFSDSTMYCASDEAVSKATAKHAEMVQSMSAAQKENGRLRELALYLQVYPDWEGVSAVEALRFARLLRDFPEAKSLLGDDAYFISAGTKDSTASLRLSMQSDLVGGLRRYGLVVSTPLGEKKRVNLYDRADGLAGTSQITLSSDVYKGTASQKSRMTLLSLGLTGGREERTYLVDGAAPREEKVYVHPIAVTLTGALFSLAEGNRDTHVVKLSWQRTHEDGEKIIRCPVPAVGAAFIDCLQGAVGSPKRVRAGLVSYQYRYLRQQYAVAPQLSYNTHSKVMDLDVPVYLVRSSDEKERPFNAGLNIGWASKGKAEITERTGGEWRYGVFIGAPFSLLELGN